MSLRRNSTCEACKTSSEEISTYAPSSYTHWYLCSSCYHRLVNKALRPLELFNLVAIHGHTGYLLDDFYDYDTGKACQSEIKVIDIRKFPFPILNDILHSTQALVDYACVQYFTSPIVFHELKKQKPQDILDYLDKKVTYCRDINYKLYEIAANVLGPFSAEWIRDQWEEHTDNELLIFAEALSKCLPFSDCFKILTSEIEKSPDNKLAENATALIYLQNYQTLPWIESIKARITNISTEWGILAAASEFDWNTAKMWIETGRPLSIIALDAILYCTSKNIPDNFPVWFREHPPKTLSTDSSEIIKVINYYLANDSVPRIRKTILAITNNLN